MRISNKLKQTLNKVDDANRISEKLNIDKKIMGQVSKEIAYMGKDIDFAVESYDDYKLLDAILDTADAVETLRSNYRVDNHLKIEDAKQNDTFKFLWNMEGLLRDTAGSLIDYSEDHNIESHPKSREVGDLVKKICQDYVSERGFKEPVKELPMDKKIEEVIEKTVQKKPSTFMDIYNKCKKNVKGYSNLTLMDASKTLTDVINGMVKNKKIRINNDKIVPMVREIKITYNDGNSQGKGLGAK